MKHDWFRRTLWMLLLASALSAPASAQTASRKTLTFNNPILTAAADPYITYTNGRYYMVYTDLTRYSVITVRSSPTLATLGAAPAVQVYDAGGFFESPELFQFGSKWYIYYTQGLYTVNVLESDTANPQGTFHYKATLTNNTYDADLLRMPSGALYLLSTDYNNIYIQPLSNPYTVSGGQTSIAVRDQSWETGAIEAPNAFWHNGQLLVLYTAGNYNRDNYAANVLRFNGGDPLNPGAWSKGQGPLFTENPHGGIWYAGVPSAFSSPDGLETWFTYSDYNNPDGADPHRCILAQPMRFDAQNNPLLDLALPLPQTIPLPSGDPNGSRQTGAAYSLTNIAAGLDLDDPGSSSAVGTPLQLYPANGSAAQSWRLDSVLTGLFPQSVYTVFNTAAGLNLEDPNGSKKTFTQVQLNTPAAAKTAQQWRFGLTPDGAYTLTNLAAGLNLDDPNGSHLAGTLLWLYPANGATAQEWALQGAPDSQGIVSGAYYTLKNAAAGLFLDDPSGSDQPFTPVQLYYGNGQTPQNWRLCAVSPGVYTVSNQASGLLRLDDPFGSHAEGTLLQLYYANTLSPQNWIFTRQPDGNYTLTNQAAGLNLDDPNGSSSPGQRLQLYHANGATAQEWTLTRQ